MVAELSKSEDPEVQALFEGVRNQDEASFLQIRGLIAQVGGCGRSGRRCVRVDVDGRGNAHSS